MEWVLFNIELIPEKTSLKKLSNILGSHQISYYFHYFVIIFYKWKYLNLYITQISQNENLYVLKLKPKYCYFFHIQVTNPALNDIPIVRLLLGSNKWFLYFGSNWTSFANFSTTSFNKSASKYFLFLTILKSFLNLLVIFISYLFLIVYLLNHLVNIVVAFIILWFFHYFISLIYCL